MMSVFPPMRKGDDVTINYAIGRKLDSDGWHVADDRVRGPGEGAVWCNTWEPFNVERELRALIARVEQLETQLKERR
jgi:hypothetical protein